MTRKCSQTQTTAKETVSAEYKTHGSPSNKRMSLLQHQLLSGITSKAKGGKAKGGKSSVSGYRQQLVNDNKPK